MLLAFTLCALVAPPSDAASVEFPIRFDTVFLTRLLKETVFSDSLGLSVWGDEDGCNDLTLSNPEVLINDGVPYILTDAAGLTGLNLAGQCIQLIRWNGKIRATQRVDIVDPNGRIQFATTDTELLDEAGEVATVRDKIWEIAQSSVYPQLDRFTINLVPAVEDIRESLPLFLDPESRSQSLAALDSLGIDRIEIEDGAIAAQIKFDIEANRVDTEEREQAALTASEIAQFEEVWIRWDAFLGFVIKFTGRYGLDRDQQDTLLESLIETRYLLVDALSRHTRHEVDPVRENFIQTWEALRPVFLQLGSKIEGADSLQLLGFIAAVDAVRALDQLSAVTGWDVSVDGLRRLARMLIDDPAVDPLQVDPATDPELRELFDFAPFLELPPAQGIPPDNPTQLNEYGPSWLDLIGSPAYAKAKPALDKLYPTSENIDVYLERIRELLRTVSAATIDSNPLQDEFHKLFEDIVYTTAWQETCWRQYKLRKGKPKPITSSAGALGMMQVMPKVWRGFYEADSLANSVEYNAAAGSEILHRYLVRYALRKKEHEHKGGIDNLVRATYAAYNGGPRHLTRYRNAKTSGSLKRIDQGFWSKFLQVREGNELAVRSCYPF